MKKTILTLMIGATLVGCGSDGGDGNNGGDNGGGGTPPSNSLSGLAIDGYIGGATAFLDENFNGVLDAGEPNAVTVDGTGTYSLPVVANAVCNDYAPIVVKVPVGATDVDATNGVVDKAYTLTLPPLGLQSIEMGNVTPITSKVWDQVAANADREGLTLTCSGLANPTSDMSKWMETAIKSAEEQVETELGVTTAEMYGDYVATSNTALHNVAKSVVEDLKVVEELKEDPANDGDDLYLVNGSALRDYGITDNASYIVKTTSAPYGTSGVTVSETIHAMDETLVYESDFTIQENANYDHKVGSAFFASTSSCEMSEYSTKKSESGVWKVETVRIDNTASQLSDCGTMDSVVEKVFTKHTTTGVEYETSESHYATSVLGSPQVGFDLSTDMSNFFASAEGVMAGYTGFEGEGTFPAATTSWTRSYNDYVDTNPVNVFTELVTYDSKSIWFKERDQSVNEFFCFNSVNVLDDAIFSGSPIDFWQETTDRNGDAVWIKLGNSIDDVTSNPNSCDMTINTK